MINLDELRAAHERFRRQEWSGYVKKEYERFDCDQMLDEVITKIANKKIIMALCHYYKENMSKEEFEVFFDSFVAASEYCRSVFMYEKYEDVENGEYYEDEDYERSCDSCDRIYYGKFLGGCKWSTSVQGKWMIKGLRKILDSAVESKYKEKMKKIREKEERLAETVKVRKREIEEIIQSVVSLYTKIMTTYKHYVTRDVDKQFTDTLLSFIYTLEKFLPIDFRNDVRARLDKHREVNQIDLPYWRKFRGDDE